MTPLTRPGAAAVACLLLLVASCAREPVRCVLCHMEVPAQTLTMATIDGKRQVICDPRCALTHRAQAGRAVRLDRVTDLATGAALDPRAAFYVTGSDTAPDAKGADRAGMRMWPAAQASLQWHRCLPSIVAFSTEDAARAHVRTHGGRVATYASLGFDAPPSR
jgi:hypothetical protein